MKIPKYRIAKLLTPLFFLTGSQLMAVVIAEFPTQASYSGGFNTAAGIATDGGRVFDNRKMQTFTPNLSGELQAVSIHVHRQVPTNASLRVTVAEVAQGQPATVLATATLSPELVGTTMLFSTTVDGIFSNSLYFDTHPFLIAGTEYALLFSTDTTEANYRLYGSYSGYSGGTQTRSQNGSAYTATSGDIYFRVTATTVPEPTTGGLILVSTLLLLRRNGQKVDRKA